jgi:hypothetical protein
MSAIRPFPLLLFLLLIAAPLLRAQEDVEDPGARERIAEFRRMKMIEKLDLNEDQAIRLAVREKDFRQQMQALEQKRDDQFEALRKLVREKAGDDALRAGMEAIRSINMEFVQKRNDYVLSLGDILSVNQMAHLVVFDNTFQKELKRMILDRSRRGGGPPHDR